MRDRHRGCTAIALAVSGICAHASAGQLDARPGWSWAAPPVRLADYGWPKHEAVIEKQFLKLVVSPPQGPGLGALVGDKKKMRVRVEYDIVWTQRSDAVEFVPVMFDDAGNRHEFGSHRGWGDNRRYTTEYGVSDKETRIDRITHVGVEMLTPDGRKDISRIALAEAGSAGIDVLPLPIVGEPFAFSLMTRSGHQATSDALRGKVVLIDSWATWCSPCMAKMPELKKLYEKYHARGFEIIGINFDETFDEMDRAVTDKGLVWPMVHVPNDDKVRDLWYRAASIRVLPRLLVIDRDGKLRADCLPQELAKEIDKLMQ